MKQIRDEDRAIPHPYLPAGFPDSMPLTQKNLSLPQLVDEICLGLVAGAGPGAVEGLENQRARGYYLLQ